MIKPDGYESEIVSLNDRIKDLRAANEQLKRSGDDLFTYTCALERIVAQADEIFDRAAHERLFPTLSDPAASNWAIDIARGVHMWQRSQIVNRARLGAKNRNASAGKAAALMFAEFAADVSALIGFMGGVIAGRAPAAIEAAADRLISAIDRTAGREPAGNSAGVDLTYSGEFSIGDLRTLATYAQDPHYLNVSEGVRKGVQAAAARVLAELERGKQS